MSDEAIEWAGSPRTCPNGPPVIEGAVFCDRCGSSLIHPIQRSTRASDDERYKPESAPASSPTGGEVTPKRPRYKRPIPLVVGAIVALSIILVVVGAATKKNTSSSGSSTATTLVGETKGAATTSANAPTSQPSPPTTAPSVANWTLTDAAVSAMWANVEAVYSDFESYNEGGFESSCNALPSTQDIAAPPGASAQQSEDLANVNSLYVTFVQACQAAAAAPTSGNTGTGQSDADGVVASHTTMSVEIDQFYADTGSATKGGSQYLRG